MAAERYGNPEEDYYDQDPRESQGSEGGEDMPSAEIPKSLLMGKKFNVGDEVVFKIAAMRPDSVVIEYATGEDEAGEGEGHRGPPAENEGEMMPAAGGGGDMYE